MRGTTPTHTFRVPIDLTGASVIYITYAQMSGVKVEKTGADITVTNETLTTLLTQEDTIKFVDGRVDMQIRARFPDGRAVKSRVISTTADRLLKEGVI